MPTFAEFSAAVGTRFRAHVSEGSETFFELTQATAGRAPASPSGKGPAYESFSLMFRGPRDRVIAQGTYNFDHDRLGSFSMFMVPIGRDNDGVQYQAVFNRLA